MNKLLAALIASLFAVSTAFAASHAGAPMPSQAASGTVKKEASGEKKDAKAAATGEKKVAKKKTKKASAKKAEEKKS